MSLQTRTRMATPRSFLTLNSSLDFIGNFGGCPRARRHGQVGYRLVEPYALGEDPVDLGPI